MDITITSRHDPLDEKVRIYIEEKLARIMRLSDRLASVHVTLDHAHGKHQAEAVVNGPRGTTFTAHSEDSDQRTAIDIAEHKLEDQIRHWKDRIVDHRPVS